MTAPSAWRRISWIKKRTESSPAPPKGGAFFVIIKGKNTFDGESWRQFTPSVCSLRSQPPSPRGRLLVMPGKFLVTFDTLVTGLTACALSVKAYGFASSPKGRAKSTPRSFLVVPNTLVPNFTAWLSLRERLRGRPLGGAVAPQGATERAFPKSSDDFFSVFFSKAAFTADFGQNSPGFGQCA